MTTNTNTAADAWTIEAYDSAAEESAAVTAALRARTAAPIMAQIAAGFATERAKHALLWRAANVGLYSCASALLDAGAHAGTTYNRMPLLWMLLGAGSGAATFAFDREREAFCEELVRRGANVDARGRGITALEACAQFGYVESVRFLLAHGACVRDFGKFRNDAPLVHAASEARTEVVEMLLAAGADPNERDGDGRTPLHAVAERSESVPIARLLLAAGADRKRLWTTPRYDTKRGVTAHKIAMKLRVRALVALLAPC